MSADLPSIIPVVLAGGKGTRLWPLSSPRSPKQFLPLIGEQSLLEQTLLRCRKIATKDIIVIGNFEHRFLLGEQVQSVGMRDHTDVLLEPIGKDSALPLALASLQALKSGHDPILCVMPADAAILNDIKWLEAMERAVCTAKCGYLTVIGLNPTRPETAYGYIEAGIALDCADQTFKVTSFKEKPDLTKAEEFLKDNKYSWNSGIFVVQASILRNTFEEHAPTIIKAAQKALDRSFVDLDFIHLDAQAFKEVSSISFDYAVMEHTDKAAVVRADFEWTDLGNWKAIKELSQEDPSGNVVQGSGFVQSGQHNYIKSESTFVAINGLSNIGVIATENAVLVSDLNQIQDIKSLVNKANELGYRSPSNKVLRPWGHYECLTIADGYQVKRISVKPQRRLSLQKHKQRSEHWLIISGKAIVTLDEKDFMVSEGESIDIPVGCIHRLENPSAEDELVLIEIQKGKYLGEDDIIRLADDFKRV